MRPTGKPVDHTAELAELRQAITLLSGLPALHAALQARFDTLAGTHRALGHRTAELEPPAPRMVLTARVGDRVR